jgi:hypothetical protein
MNAFCNSKDLYAGRYYIGACITLGCLGGSWCNRSCSRHTQMWTHAARQCPSPELKLKRAHQHKALVS